jgi:hypothetical protein
MKTSQVGVSVWVGIAATITILSGISAISPANAQSPVPVSIIAPVPPEQVLAGVVPDLPPGYMIVEGDIQIRIEDFERLYGAGKGALAPESTDGAYQFLLWPSGVVPYEFDANVTAANQTAMRNAMNRWQDVANVRFQQCASNACSDDFVHIQNSTSNNSAIGRQGGRQVINIVSWGNEFIMAHELAHALGFVHEQSRPNRNTFVQINSANICKAGDPVCSGGFCFNNAGNRIDCDGNFALDTTASHYGPYDFDSVMHYPRNAFSRNMSDTITVLAPYTAQWQNAIGQRDHLSSMDQVMMRALYRPPSDVWVDANFTGVLPSGTFFWPYTSFATAYTEVPSGGTLFIKSGDYDGPTVYTKKVVLWAPAGGVVLR